MRATRLVPVLVVAFAAGSWVGVLWATDGNHTGSSPGSAKSTSAGRHTDRTDDPCSAASSHPASDRGATTTGTCKGSLEEQVAALERALARERSRSADLTRQLDELQRGAKGDADTLAFLDEPCRWLRRLLPVRFAGLTCAELKTTRELDLSESNLDIRNLAYLARLPALRWLTLRRTPVDDVGLTFLLQVPTLVRLGLRETQVTDAGMATLGAMKQLQHLDLNMQPITDRGLQELRSLPSLKLLRLNYTQVTDAGMEHVARLQALQRLDLWGTRVTDEGLDRLWHLPALRHLELGATAVSKDWVERFLREHPNCQVRSR